MLARLRIAVLITAIACFIYAFGSIVLLHATAFDGNIYQYQAQTYSHGNVYHPETPWHRYFSQVYVFELNGKRFGQYPFGHPLLLVPGVWLNNPWIVTPFIGALSLLLFFLIVQRWTSSRVAWMSTILAGVSPFFVYQSASLFSHITCGFFFLLSVYIYQHLKDRPRTSTSLLLGLVAGYAVSVRYIEGVALIAALSCALLTLLIQRHTIRRRHALAYVIGLSVMAIVIATFNATLTGHPFSPPASVNHRDYLVFSWSQFQQGLHGVITNFTLFQEWTGIAWAFAVFPLLAHIRRPLWTPTISAAYLYLFVILSIYVFYNYFHDPGGQFGPRYLFGLYYIAPYLTAILLDQFVPRRWVGMGIALIVLYNLYAFSRDLPRIQRDQQDIADLPQHVSQLPDEKAIVFIQQSYYYFPLTSPWLDDRILFPFFVSPVEREAIKAHFPGRRAYVYHFPRIPGQAALTLEEDSLDYHTRFSLKSVPAPQGRRGGIRGLYRDSTHSFTRTDASIYFLENFFLPPPVGTEGLSIEWSGYLYSAITQPYTLYFASDDGHLVTIDNQVVMENWTIHKKDETFVKLVLEKGYHSLDIHYFNGSGGTVAQFGYVDGQGKRIPFSGDQLCCQ